MEGCPVGSAVRAARNVASGTGAMLLILKRGVRTSMPTKIENGGRANRSLDPPVFVALDGENEYARNAANAKVYK